MAPLGQQLGSPAIRYRLGRLQPTGARVVTGAVAAPPPGPGPDPTNRLARRRRLEAILLLAREPLPPRRLAQLANLTDGTEARTLVRELQTAYQSRGAALAVEKVAGGYRLLTRPVLAPWIERFSSRPETPPMSAPAAETLAVVAYRQPVVRAEVEAIRGVQSGELLRQLMQRGLLRIVGRSEELGRPLLYGTTKQFLQEYGLKSLDDLPAGGAPGESVTAPQRETTRDAA